MQLEMETGFIQGPQISHNMVLSLIQATALLTVRVQVRSI